MRGGVDRRRDFIIGVLLVSLCAGSFLILAVHAKQSRIFLKSPAVSDVAEGGDAFGRWESGGVRGRVLYLFDRRIHETPRDGAASDDNFVYLAIRSNIVRKVVHIIPDVSWEDVAGRLSGAGNVRSAEGRFETTIMDAPLVIMRLGDIRSEGEPVLVHVNSDNWDEPSFARIAGFLAQGVLTSDLITLTGEGASARAEEIRGDL